MNPATIVSFGIAALLVVIGGSIAIPLVMSLLPNIPVLSQIWWLMLGAAASLVIGEVVYRRLGLRTAAYVSWAIAAALVGLGLMGVVSLPSWFAGSEILIYLGGTILAIATIFGTINLARDPNSRQKSMRIATTVLTAVVIIAALRLVLGEYLVQLWVWFTSGTQSLTDRHVISTNFEGWHLVLIASVLFALWAFTSMSWLRTVVVLFALILGTVITLITYKEEIKGAQGELGELLPSTNLSLPSLSGSGVCPGVEKVHLFSGRPSATVIMCANGGKGEDIMITTGRMFSSIGTRIVQVTMQDGRVLSGTAIDDLVDRRELCSLSVHRSLSPWVVASDCYVPHNVVGNTTQFVHYASVTGRTLVALGASSVTLTINTTW